MTTPQKERAKNDLFLLQKVERTLSKVRPFLRSEGSDVSIKDYYQGELLLTVTGACVGCALAGHDLGELAELLKSEIEEVEIVRYYNLNGLEIM